VVFPIHDERAAKRQGFRPWANWILIGCNVLVFLYLQMFPFSAVFSAVLNLGLVPAELLHAFKGEYVMQRVPPLLTLVTNTFLHNAWWHLLGNMLVLWVFGDDVEQATGHLRYLLLYVLAGIAGGLAHAFSDLQSMMPLIGASGAIAGVLGAYILLRPQAKIIVLFAIVPIRMRAIWFIGIWLALQVLGLFVPQQQILVSYWGHLGGFVMGILALLVLHKRDVPLFGRQRGSN
jgi:membrane associated rhomboid family serine protease